MIDQFGRVLSRAWGLGTFCIADGDGSLIQQTKSIRKEAKRGREGKGRRDIFAEDQKCFTYLRLVGRKRGEEREKRLKIRKKKAWKACRAWRGAGAPLGGAREPQFAPPRGCFHFAFCADKSGEGGKQPSLPFISRLKKKHPLPLGVRAGKAGICFTAACWLAENKQNDRG